MTNFLTQSELAQRLINKANVSPETAKAFSTVFFKIVKKGLKTSDRFSVYNFGTFKKTWIEATTGLNPSSGERINIPAHWRIKFVPCSSVAKRINKPYANLKPKPIDDLKIGPDGLYAKAEKYANQPDEAEKAEAGEGLLAAAEKLNAQGNAVYSEEERKTSSVPAPVSVQEDEPDVFDEQDDEEENERKSSAWKIAGIAGLSGICILLLVSLLIKSCSSKPKAKRVEAQKIEPETAVEKTEESQTVKSDSKYDEIESEILFESYLVPTGKNYHTIAEEKLGNRHLWPLLYSANKAKSSDPDFIPSYAKIKLPENAGNYSEKQLASAFLDAYNGYLLMIEKQPESRKNELRRNRAVRVLVSAEIVQPGFIQKNRARILPEYAQLAQNIVNHQIKN